MDGNQLNNYLGGPSAMVKKADFFFKNESTSDAYPNGIVDININKILTIQAYNPDASTNITPNQQINCFMMAYNQNNLTPMTEWRIRSYYFIRVTAKIIGFHQLYGAYQIS
jgi:hypothetical protein